MTTTIEVWGRLSRAAALDLEELFAGRCAKHGGETELVRKGLATWGGITDAGFDVYLGRRTDVPIIGVTA